MDVVKYEKNEGLVFLVVLLLLLFLVLDFG